MAARMLSFLGKLSLDKRLPAGVKLMNPYKDPYSFSLCAAFYEKYYSDNDQRTLLLGINPGRFGSGTTGISFTDPLKLEKICNIPNTLPKKPELSADFIYMMIEAFGGPGVFYRKYLISAVSPLGFVKEGLNINYYDIPALQKAVTPFIIESVNQMLNLGLSRDRCFCIGEGKNFIFLDTQNKKQGWFKEVIPLPHPRFIMQYRRKKLQTYIDIYLNALK